MKDQNCFPWKLIIFVMGEGGKENVMILGQAHVCLEG